ncbi:D-alanyl-D-alanine carboxypeptidase family protein [Lentibacillus sediminis]|uniref:D-alanyl-D-alanine carboxypeptidase family protein n=1 Tax=Lentibacillus sediminis TaxID=1940529 RepID=UPI000C1BD661|nr:D-alanyl-D-alanine carboxypeptidase family protein [Lentibacillus sediminis]
MSIKNLSIILAMAAMLTTLAACALEETGDPQAEPEPAESTAPAEAEKPEPEPETDPVQVPEAGLQKLDQGEDVKMLQRALNEIGYSIPENGMYDEITTWAVTDFQLQQENLAALGVFNEETRTAMESVFSAGEAVEAGAGLPQDVPASGEGDDTRMLMNPYDQLALVNKQQALPANYTPQDMVVPDIAFPFTEDLPKKQMRATAAAALEELFAAAEEAGLDLFAQSGYRSYDRQDYLFASYSEQHGEKAANKFSARPGESEHQTGLTMDVTSPEVNFQLTTDFAKTDEGKWLTDHAADFGFIIRYPKGSEDITGYQYEPWHLRYVGEKAAQAIAEEGITLEEYLGEVE